MIEQAAVELAGQLTVPANAALTPSAFLITSPQAILNSYFEYATPIASHVNAYWVLYPVAGLPCVASCRDL